MIGVYVLIPSPLKLLQTLVRFNFPDGVKLKKSKRKKPMLPTGLILMSSLISRQEEIYKDFILNPI